MCAGEWVHMAWSILSLNQSSQVDHSPTHVHEILQNMHWSRSRTDCIRLTAALQKIGRQKFVQVGNQQFIGRQNRARKNRLIFDVTRPTFCRPINSPIYRPTKSRSSDIGFRWKTRLLSKGLTTRECVRTLGHFGHVITRWRSDIWSAVSAVTENSMLHAHFMALCFIEPELLPIEVLHSGNSDRFLLMWPWRWPDEIRIRT